MRTITILLVASFLAGCGPKQVSYNKEVQPVLNAHCVKCHGGEKMRAKISLVSYEAVMNARSITDQGTIVTAGNAATSRLYVLCATEQAQYRMPPDTFHLAPVAPEELGAIGRWIMQGAKNN